jgi:hypothetical protein
VTAKGQENNASPPSAQKAPEPAGAPSESHAKPGDPVREFGKVLKYVHDRGSYTLLEAYVCITLGLTHGANQGEMGQVGSTAYISDLDNSRVAYLLETKQVILTKKTGKLLTVYLVDHKGKLEKAATTEKSRAFTMIRLPLAAQGFEEEKKFWIKEANFSSD